MLRICVLFACVFTIFLGSLRADEPKTLEIYRDRSWTHIGNGSFSSESDAASDLTGDSIGETHTVEIPLDGKSREAIRNPQWKSAVLTGEVIGNDTGKLGNCSATVVRIDGNPIGEITQSGHFRIAFPKKRLQNKVKVQIMIKAGNAFGDADDQELGQFLLSLSEERITPQPANAEKPETSSPSKTTLFEQRQQTTQQQKSAD